MNIKELGNLYVIYYVQKVACTCTKSFLLMLYNIFLDESVGQWLIQNTEQNDSWNDGFSYLKFALQKCWQEQTQYFTFKL